MRVGEPLVACVSVRSVKGEDEGSVERKYTIVGLNAGVKQLRS